VRSRPARSLSTAALANPDEPAASRAAVAWWGRSRRPGPRRCEPAARPVHDRLDVGHPPAHVPVGTTRAWRARGGPRDRARPTRFGNVGRVAHEQGHAAEQRVGESLEPATEAEPHPLGHAGVRDAHPVTVDGGDRQGRGSSSTAQTETPGWAAAASSATDRAITPEPVPRSTTTGPGAQRRRRQLEKGSFDYLFGLGPWDEDPAVDDHVERAERPWPSTYCSGSPACRRRASSVTRAAALSSTSAGCQARRPEHVVDEPARLACTAELGFEARPQLGPPHPTGSSSPAS